MKLLNRLTLLFLLTFSRPCFGQDTSHIIKASWKNLKTELVNRTKIINQFIAIVSKSKKADKNILAKTKKLSTDLSQYIDTLKQLNSSTISTTVDKNNNLTKSLARTFLTLENDSKFNVKNNVFELIAKVEGIENRIALKKMEYNQTCTKYNKHELLFKNNEETTEKAPEIKF